VAQRLKIAQIITRLDRGGSADVAVALCERLDRARFDVTLVAGPADAPVVDPAELARRADITVAECPDLVREVSPRRDLRALLALRKYLAKLRPDVVHTHTSKAGALGRLAARLAGRVPVVHAPHGHLFYGYYGRLGTGLVVTAERALAPLAERIAVLTDASRDEHLARGIGCSWQYVTVPSGIDLDRFRPDAAAGRAMRAEFGLGEAFVVGWAGRFVEVKGPDLFVEACGRMAAELPAARFVLAGDGPLRGAAESRAAELALADRFRFLGPRDDMAAVFNACDVLAVSSRNEGLGLAAVEAMACGVPVVATAVGGLPELLGGGRSGALVGPTDVVRAMAEAVVRLAGDPEAGAALGRAGRERAGVFGIDKTVERFADLYEELAR
jgi:glycosyltransferase involved in cell wall biosynthesis